MGIFNQKNESQKGQLFVKIKYAKTENGKIIVDDKELKQPFLCLFETNQRKADYGQDGFSTFYNKRNDPTYWIEGKKSDTIEAADLPGKYCKTIICIDSNYKVFVMQLTGTNLSAWIEAKLENSFSVTIAEAEVINGRSKIVYDKFHFKPEKNEFDEKKTELAVIAANVRLWLIQKTHPAADLSPYNLIPADDLDEVFGKE